MDEYIERKKLVGKLNDIIRECEGVLEAEFVRDIIEDVVEIVKRQPAADVAPVQHGRWVEKEKYTFGIMCDCSLCENRILDNGHPWNYCPNCGAKMDEEETT